MVDEDPVVAADKEQLEHLDKDIAAARQHLKEQTHEDERSFIDDGDESRGETDDAIVPPG